MIKRKKAWALALTASLAMALSACGNEEPPVSDSESAAGNNELDSVQELRLTTGSGIPTMDSVMADDAVSFTMLNNAGEGLYRLDQQSTPIPAMASGEPEISEDGLTYTFTLREANWSDGSPVTAHDFVFAWQRAADPETGSTYGPYMMAGTIKNAAAIAEGKLDKSELGITAQDDQTLVVSLERPIPYFLSLMAFGTFYPQNEAYVTEHGDEYAMDSSKLLSNGPFVLANWDATAASWELEKNPEYWDADNVKLDKVEFNIIPDPGTGVNLYETGEADRAGLAGEFAMQYAEHEEVVRILKPSVYYLQFNQERDGKATPLANPKLRKALALSFNKQDLADIVLANGSIPADFLVPTEFTFDADQNDFRSVNGDMMEFNAEQAKALWAEGMEEEGLTEVSLEYLSGDTELSKKIDAYMKDQMEGNLSGLTLEMSQVPFNVLLDKNEAQDYDIQSTGWGPDFQDPITFLDIFASGSSQNTMSYSNEHVDELLEQAKGELALKPEERWQALAEAEKIIVEEDAAVANMYQFGSMALQKPYVHDVIAHPFTGDFSYKWAYIAGRE